MKSEMRFILKRAGQFKCHWSNFDGRCGTDPNPIQTYNYLCQIETNDALDENGFIVDQIDVNAAFQNQYHPKPHKAKSCELIALEMVTAIQMLVHKQSSKKIKVYRVAVSIDAIPPAGVIGDASITAEWAAK